MKLIIILFGLLAYSCNLNDNCDTEPDFDYYIGESFVINADQVLKLKDPTTEKIYNLWFSGPVEDNRFPPAVCDTISGYSGHGYVYMQFIDVNRDTSLFTFRLGNCLSKWDDSTGSPNINEIKYGFEFRIHHTRPYIITSNQTIAFDEYYITMSSNKIYSE